MPTKKEDADQVFSKREARLRFEAALRGARLVGHKPQSEMKVGKRKKQKRGYATKAAKH